MKKFSNFFPCYLSGLLTKPDTGFAGSPFGNYSRVSWMFLALSSNTGTMSELLVVKVKV